MLMEVLLELELNIFPDMKLMIHSNQIYLFICKFNMDNFQMPLKLTFLDKFLNAMLAD